MKRFNYKAKDKAGKLVSGEVEAPNILEAARLVHKKNLVVISVKPAFTGPLFLLKNFRQKVKSDEITSFTRQLATMINAGLPVTDSLVILRNQTQGGMQKVVAQILADVEGGQSLSTAFAKHAQVFSPTYIALLKSGEAGGVMDQVLARLADNLEKQQEFGGKVKGALIYPAIVIIGMFVVGIVMMIFVIPRLTSLYSEFNAKLPLPTLILISLSNLMIKFWPLCLVLAFLVFIGFSRYYKTKSGHRKIDELTFKIPIVGILRKQVILTELTQTLALMVGSGVSILDSLTITAGVVGNVVVSEAMIDAADNVEKGFPIAYSFAKHAEVFPFILSQMIAVGEETGKMEEVLGKLAHIFEVEADQRVKALTSAIEPLVMVLLGLGVGFLVIAVILPIYNLTSQF
jgi:type IV pilus assembly protein PilC